MVNSLMSMVVFVLIPAYTAYYLSDESFGSFEDPRWLKRSMFDEYDELPEPDDDQFNVQRRSYNRFMSKYKSVIPYYLHRDGINYGGRPGGGFYRPWNRPFGVSRLGPRFGLMSIHSRSRPIGISK